MSFTALSRCLRINSTGLAARLLGLEAPQQHPMRGLLFENWVVADLLEQRGNLFFWRHHTGLAVDLLADHAGGNQSRQHSGGGLV